MASGERWRIIRDMFRIHSRYVFDPCVFRPALLYYADCVLVKCARSTTNTLFLPAAKSIYYVFNRYKKKGGRKEDETNRQHSETEARRFLVKSAWDSNPASSTGCKKNDNDVRTVKVTVSSKSYTSHYKFPEEEIFRLLLFLLLPLLILLPWRLSMRALCTSHRLRRLE